MFRGTNRTFHQSVVLVNAVLVPRSLSPAGFYGANFAGRKVLSKTASRARGKFKYSDFIKEP